jgi:melibiose permease/lactose/raffinose/galactose permease
MTLAFSGLNEKVIKPVTDTVNANPDMETADIRSLISSLVNDEMLLGLRTSMIIIPLILILLSFFIYRMYYKIDSKMYQQITDDLMTRIISEEKPIEF